ncbi:alpha/beta hydrolase-fold protein [Streptomyces mobaraensis]|uniref:alpha/beta hydrolase n=1 Tax=Streptomyces mobaraensis TaxID=35621 RepID=UPI0033310897
MSLMGTPFFVTTIALVVVALVLPLLVWSRIPGPKFVRFATRLLMLLFAQAAAITAVFVVVNDDNDLYDNWDDLLGTGNHVTSAAYLGADGTGGKKLKDLPKVVQKFTAVTDPLMGEGVRRTQLKGAVSGVSGEVYVWTPPQYDDPRFKDKKFPVVEVLPGFPGSAKAWFGSLKVNEQLKPMMERGEIQPFVIVAPRTTLLGGNVDTGCANTPGKINADTWLSFDVRKMVVDNFRVSDKPKAWGVAGYSAGAHCAAKLTIAHPDRFHAGVSLSGYNDPAGVPSSLTARTPDLRRANNPQRMLEGAGTPPHVALFFSGGELDGYRAGMDVKKVAKPPTAVVVKKIPAAAGGHNTAVWKEQVPEVFRWLGKQLAP